MKVIGIFILSLITVNMATAQNTIHEFEFETIDGETKSFKDFSGKKILIFNAASECGFTPQYEGLEKLHKKYQDQLIVIGFPANNFGAQEPGSNEEIATFCQKNYGVSFTMAAKVSVSGDDIHPIFRWLTSQENESFTGTIKWNFEKFLLDENGVLTHRFRSNVEPMAKELTKHI